jgi:hypothetical protein
VSGQLHAPAALPPEKEPPVPIGYEAGWAPEPVWTTWRRENSWPYRGRPARSQSPYRLRYPGSQDICSWSNMPSILHTEWRFYCCNDVDRPVYTATWELATASSLFPNRRPTDNLTGHCYKQTSSKVPKLSKMKIIDSYIRTKMFNLTEWRHALSGAAIYMQSFRQRWSLLYWLT